MMPGIIREVDIDGVVIKDLTRHKDERGWLCELFRVDELEETVVPVMSYLSLTLPGARRGPHEHKDQTDYFCFVGPSTFKLYFWDNREGSPTNGKKFTIETGEDAPMLVIVPPGVVHAYKNIGEQGGLVFNAPNRLYMGHGKTEPVDEIRYEDMEDSEYKLD